MRRKFAYLAQPITLPAGCSTYQLRFWMHIDTDETTTQRSTTP